MKLSVLDELTKEIEEINNIPKRVPLSDQVKCIQSVFDAKKNALQTAKHSMMMIQAKEDVIESFSKSSSDMLSTIEEFLSSCGKPRLEYTNESNVDDLSMMSSFSKLLQDASKSIKDIQENQYTQLTECVKSMKNIVEKYGETMKSFHEKIKDLSEDEPSLPTLDVSQFILSKKKRKKIHFRRRKKLKTIDYVTLPSINVAEDASVVESMRNQSRWLRGLLYCIFMHSTVKDNLTSKEPPCPVCHYSCQLEHIECKKCGHCGQIVHLYCLVESRQRSICIPCFQKKHGL